MDRILPAEETTTEEYEPVGGQSRQRCVLLAEDDRSVRRYLEVILQRAGYKVISAADGLEAMKLALSSPIDAVIADSIMPHLTGQELCRLLRSNPKVSRLPMVLLTAMENRTNLNTQDLQLDAYLYKPVTPEDVISCLSRLFETSD